MLDFLIESELSDDRVQAFFDRLMLRLFSSPGLLAAFVTASAFEDKGDTVVQLEFQRLPNDIHPDLLKIAGAANVQLVEYDRDSTPYTGLQIRLSNDELRPPRAAAEVTICPAKLAVSQA